MSTDPHVTERLSDFLDGELEAHEHRAVEQHLAECAECRQVERELRGVLARAAVAIDDDQRPAQDLWPGIAERIGQGRVAPFVPRRRFSFTLPQLAAAGIALMVLSGGLVWLATSGHTRQDFPAVVASDAPMDVAVRTAGADAQFEGAVEDLEAILARERARLDPQTVRVLEANLQAIDAAIAQSRAALERDPANAFLNSHLAAARQRKLALLRRATALTAGS